MKNILLYVTSERNLYDLCLKTDRWICLNDNTSINVGAIHRVANKNNYILAMVCGTLDRAVVDSKLLRKVLL
jgi:hypothetical protein